jgi:hypothetical protein
MARKFVFNPLTGKFDIIDVAPVTDTVEEVPFAFNSTTPMVLQQVFPGQVLNRCTILVVTPFDDPAAFIKVGTSFNTSLVLGASDVSLGILGNSYEQAALFPFSITDFLQLTISPGASTQGAGLLLYKLR